MSSSIQSPHTIVRVRIDEARRAGCYDAYAAIAIGITATHPRLRHADWQRIRQQSANNHTTTTRPDRLKQTANIVRRAGHAARSVVKTTLGIDRATDEQVEARLDVCRSCPGGHAMSKNGDVYTCGLMLESLKREGKGTCGCILRKKARDLAEDCPFGWWPKRVQDEHESNGERREIAVDSISNP